MCFFWCMIGLPDSCINLHFQVWRGFSSGEAVLHRAQAIAGLDMTSVTVKWPSLLIGSIFRGGR